MASKRMKPVQGGPPPKSLTFDSQRGATPWEQAQREKSRFSFPRFLVASRTDGQDFKLVKSILFSRHIEGVYGELDDLKKMRNGSLLLKTRTADQADRLLKCAHFGDMPVKVEEHRSLNLVRGVIFHRDLILNTDEELMEDMKNRGVTHVRRITRKVNGEDVATGAFIVSFKLSVLPEKVKVTSYRCDVRPYIPPPMRCYNCQRFGHMVSRCSNKSMCATCGKETHGEEQCIPPNRCTNCPGLHSPRDRNCPVYLSEKKIQEIKTLDGLSYQEARRRYEWRMCNTHQRYGGLLEDETEDQLLARALEESRKFYNEVEIPRLSQLEEDRKQVNATPNDHQSSRPGPSNSLWNVCRAPEYPLQLETEEEGEVVEISPPLSPRASEVTPGIGLDANGFDLTAGETWIYPTNFPLRDYQFNIVKNALFKNTLVSLPTGLGKTFIAAVVMYNFYRWYPQCKIMFLAPTKPLVHQQIDSCYNIMGIPKSDTAEMTGAMPPTDREVAWRERRMFFLTPQVVTNDLSRGICPPEQIKCVVFDEAHKAIGNHAYCQVMKALIPFNREFRVLALSATPGNDMLAVQKVIENLHISHLEMRNEQSLDTAQYTHHRKVDTIVAKIQGYHKEVRDRYMAVVEFYVRRLLESKVLYGSVSTISKFRILTARENFRKNPPSGMPPNMIGSIESDFAVCMSLFHGLELLTVHGLRSCLRYISGLLEDDGTFSGVKARLSADETFVQLMQDLTDKLGPLHYTEPEPNNSIIVDPTQQQSFVCSHPKMEHIRDVVVQHFEMFEQKGETTRVMIFCQYRDTVVEVCHVLSRYRPLVKPMTFIGQSSGKKSRGLSQKQQLMVMKKFRAGGYNTLISTCVGEEGLDIGDVDLIVCFDAHNSPIRLIQRMGRTGRKREGRIVMLMTEGKEYQKYRQSVANQNTMNKNLAHGERLKLVPNSPRMIPDGLKPRCHQMFMTMPKQPSPKAKKRCNQDLRTMLLNQKSKRKAGIEEVNDSFEDDADDEIPMFNMLPETKFLHSYTNDELQRELSSEKEEIVSFSRHLDRIIEGQDTVLVSHSSLSEDLISLLKLADSKREKIPQTQTAALASQLNMSVLWPDKKKRKRKSSAEQQPEKKKSKKSKTSPQVPQPSDKQVATQSRLAVLWSNVTDSLRKRPNSDPTMPPPSVIPKKRRKFSEGAVSSKSNCEDADIVLVEEDISSENENMEENYSDEQKAVLEENWALIEKLLYDLQMWQSEGGEERTCCIFEPVLRCKSIPDLLDISEETGIKNKLHKIVSDLPDPEHLVCSLDETFLENFHVRDLSTVDNELTKAQEPAELNIKENSQNSEGFTGSSFRKNTQIHRKLSLSRDLCTDQHQEPLIRNTERDHFQPDFYLGITQLFDIDGFPFQSNDILCENQDSRQDRMSKEDVKEVGEFASHVDISEENKEFALRDSSFNADLSDFVDKSLLDILGSGDNKPPSSNDSVKCADQKPLQKSAVACVTPDRLFSEKAVPLNDSHVQVLAEQSADLENHDSPGLAVSPILCSQKSRLPNKKRRKLSTSTPRIPRKSLFTVNATIEPKLLKMDEDLDVSLKSPSDQTLKTPLQAHLGDDLLDSDYCNRINKPFCSEFDDIPHPVSATDEKPDRNIQEMEEGAVVSDHRPATKHLNHGLTSCKAREVELLRTVTHQNCKVEENSSVKKQRSGQNPDKECTEYLSNVAIFPELLSTDGPPKVDFNLFDDPFFCCDDQVMEGNDSAASNSSNSSTGHPNANVDQIQNSAEKSERNIFAVDHDVSSSVTNRPAKAAWQKLHKNSLEVKDIRNASANSSSSLEVKHLDLSEEKDGSPMMRTQKHQNPHSYHSLEDSFIVRRPKKKTLCKALENSSDSPVQDKSNLSHDDSIEKKHPHDSAIIQLSDEDDEVFLTQPLLLNKRKTKNKENSVRKSLQLREDDKEEEGNILQKYKKTAKVAVKAKEYIEEEAEESQEMKRESTDGEDTSGLDDYDDSFVDDEETEANERSVDIQAKYLQSVRSPLKGRGQFKMPAQKDIDLLPMTVFSQDDLESVASYEEDSFCVDEEESEDSDVQDTLDIIEAVLEQKVNRRKGNLKHHKSSPKKENDASKKRRRRIQTFSSESEDERPDLPPTQVPFCSSPLPVEKSAPKKCIPPEQNSTLRYRNSNPVKEIKHRDIQAFNQTSKDCTVSKNIGKCSKIETKIVHSKVHVNEQNSTVNSHEKKSSINTKSCSSSKKSDIPLGGVNVFEKEVRKFSPNLPTVITPQVSDKPETKQDFPEESNFHLKNSSTKQTNSPVPMFENEMAVIEDLGIESWDDDDFMPPSSISLLAPLHETRSSSVQPHKPTPIENKKKPLIEYLGKIGKESKSVETNSNAKLMISMDKKTLDNVAIKKDLPRTDVKSLERRYPAVCSIVRSGEISKPRALTHSEGSKSGHMGTSPMPLDGRFVKSHGSSNHKDSPADVGLALKSSNSASDSKQNISSVQSPLPMISKVQISTASTSSAVPEFSPQKSGPAPESSVSMKQDLVILVSSRQVSSALEVITALKAKHKVTVDIRTMNVAHFAVSWRVGVIRVTLADFMRFGYWSSLQDTVLELRSLFQLPYIAVENNRANPLASGDDETPFWASHSTGMAGKLRTLGVRLFFSDNKDCTAHILSLLCERERQKGHGIILPPLQSNVQSVLKFLQALPGVNLALAMKICMHFATVATFIKCCNSVASIQQITGVSRDSALLIHDLLSSVSI